MTDKQPKRKARKKKKSTSAAHTALGKRIKEVRIAKGYTNYEYFAYEHGFSRSQYGRYENGEDLRFSSLVKLIDAFDMTFEEFFKGFKKGYSTKTSSKKPVK